MKERIGICLALAVLLALGFLGFHHSGATPQLVTVAAEYMPNELLVKFKTATPEIAVIQAIDAVQGIIVTDHKVTISASQWVDKKSEYRSFIGDPDLFLIRVPAALGIGNAIGIFSANSSVECVEKNFIVHATYLPNDTRFYDQWALNNIGQTQGIGGTIDSDIDALEAWDIFTGSPDVVIAILDGGINYEHDDLSANIWTNPANWEGRKGLTMTTTAGMMICMGTIS